MNRIGFIGAGNMGTAMIRGLAQANLVKREEIIVGGRNLEKLKPLEAEFTGLQITTDTEKLVEQADIIILAVKPYTNYKRAQKGRYTISTKRSSKRSSPSIKKN